MERISRGLLTLTLICVLVALSARNGSAEVVDRIVAEVNDDSHHHVGTAKGLQNHRGPRGY